MIRADIVLILKELREMKEPTASYTVYADGSGMVTLSKSPSIPVKRFCEFYFDSTRWRKSKEGYVTLRLLPSPNGAHL